MGGADRLDEHALEELIHRTVVDITRQIAKIDLRLCSQDPDPANELCTLHTTIDGVGLACGSCAFTQTD